MLVLIGICAVPRIRVRGRAAVSVVLNGWHALLYLQALCEGGAFACLSPDLT